MQQWMHALQLEWSSSFVLIVKRQINLVSLRKYGELCHDRQRFTGLATSDLLFLEIYAGTARLSKAARDAGLQVLPIDKTSMRASQIFVAQYDVTNPEELAALLELIETEHKRVLAVHLAPACGTASRAREKKLSNLARKGFKIPVPLRSKEKPMGLDGLQGTDKLRTESANIVYSATATIVKLCQKLDLLCSIENPANSLFWFSRRLRLFWIQDTACLFTTACMVAQGIN